jgi:4-amino-4-deoxy-L-arabinose transferase-like glycosyltransferase
LAVKKLKYTCRPLAAFNIMKVKTLYNIALLFLISAFLTVVNYFWIKYNLSHLPPPWDQSAYIYMSLNEYEILRQGDIIQFVKTVMTQAPHIAPLFPITVIPFFMLFGVSIQTAYLVNGLYIFILLVSVFFAAEKIAGKKAAFLSVFLVSTFPAVIAYSRDFLLEFPLAALTALSYLFFLKSDSFEGRKHSILFGICAGLAVLTKTMGIVFFVMPFFYGIYVFLRTSREIRKNIIYACLAAFCVISVYYIPNFKQIFGYLFYYGMGAGSQNYDQGVSSIYSLKYWTVYFENIAFRGISICYLFLFIASTVAILFSRKKKLSREYWMLWLWFICGYVLLSIPRNKGFEQYALPILTPLALITAVHISKISLKPAKYIMLIVALVIGMTNYVYQTKSERCLYDSFFFEGKPVLIPENSVCGMQNAVDINDDWDIRPLLHYMDNLNTDKARVINVLVAANHNFLNICNLRLYAFLENSNGTLSSEFQFEMLANKPSDVEEVKQLMRESHFIITKTVYQGPDFGNLNNSIVKNLLSNKVPLKSFTMSDGSVVSVYAGSLNIYAADTVE